MKTTLRDERRARADENAASRVTSQAPSIYTLEAILVSYSGHLKEREGFDRWIWHREAQFFGLKPFDAL